MTNGFNIAIVGAATLKGKELKDVIEELNFPVRDVKLLDEEDSLGKLESVGAGATVIDLSYALDEEHVPVRSPWVERERGHSGDDFSTTAVTVAHPVATILGLILLRARRVSDVRTAAVTVLEPVSEQGKRGMDELHQQTVHLLSFQPLPKDVFGEQVAFNMLARYGEGASLSLEQTQRRIARHFEKITNGEAPVPSLMLLQAPTFHGHTFSIYIEMERDCDVADLERALEGDHLAVQRPEVRPGDDEEGDDLPSNVNAAGQNGAGLLIRREPARKNAFWIWAAADNLRIAAVSAIECAGSLSALRPSGKVQ